jgi:hypothetical protein
LNSDQREQHKHTIRKLKTEIYEYESELRTNPDEERRAIVKTLVLNLRRKLVELEDDKQPESKELE